MHDCVNGDDDGEDNLTNFMFCVPFIALTLYKLHSSVPVAGAQTCASLSSCDQGKKAELCYLVAASRSAAFQSHKAHTPASSFMFDHLCLL